MKPFIPQYVEAVCQEMKIVSEAAGERICAKTLFFGGGTPSLVSVSQYQKILETCRANFDLSATT
ncbi:MAG: hypothetical protein Q7U31_10060, partial [Anaerolineaceae bacterium]|nr:hypothetical protein [Anaerolineaceae bacterium]